MKHYFRIIKTLISLLFISGCTPELGARTTEPVSVIWYDDYFTIEYIDSETIAIGEPRYHQQNYSYLIIGDSRAVLFDSGSGVRNIKPVVESLTKLPVTVSQSHLHYDHIGNHKEFGGAALPDLSYLRNRAESGKLPINLKEYLGFVENIKTSSLEASEWWSRNSNIDLGGRILTVIFTPGHTKDSMMLYDQDRKLLFTGDFIYPGQLFAMLPGSSLQDYLASTRYLLGVAPSETKLLTAHRDQSSVKFGAPVLSHADLIDLQKSLERIINKKAKGEGFYIKTYRINDRIELMTD